MFKEYDRIRALVDINSQIKKGCEGIVLYVYPDSANIVEVEFFNAKLETIAVLTLNDNDITQKGRNITAVWLFSKSLQQRFLEIARFH